MTLPPDLSAALDRYIAEMEPGMTREEAILSLVQDALIGAGFLDVPEEE